MLVITLKALYVTEKAILCITLTIHPFKGIASLNLLSASGVLLLVCCVMVTISIKLLLLSFYQPNTYYFLLSAYLLRLTDILRLLILDL